MSDTADTDFAAIGYDLASLGWDAFFERHSRLEAGSCLLPARISMQQKKLYRVLTEFGEREAIIAGKLRHGAATLADFPVVGDWVLVRTGSDGRVIIERVLPRKTKISRDTGTRKGRRKITDEQVIVANVDTVFLVAAMNEEFNSSRIDRYMTLILDGGAKPVLLLNKADLCADVEPFWNAVRPIAETSPVHIVSATEGYGLNALYAYLKSGETAALLGSSGVGKSTLINALLGMERLTVAETAAYKDRGRHATTHRELIILPSGGLLIDNPGMRSLQLWEGDKGAVQSFPEIELYAQRCRFNDCRHLNEPGCAVRQALAKHKISVERYSSFIKLQEELKFRAQKENWAKRESQQKRWKQTAKRLHDKAMDEEHE